MEKHGSPMTDDDGLESNCGNDAVVPQCFWVTSNRRDQQLACCSWTGSSQRRADPASVSTASVT